MSTTKVIYLDKLGLKVYNIDSNSSALEKDIKSLDIDQIKSELDYISNQSVLLLLADSVSYFYEKIIDPPLKIDNNLKNNLLEIIKTEIPEDFSNFNWDYKVEKDAEQKQKVTIFAPTKDFQLLINEISNQLNIKFEAIENESSASSRDVNPIVGITKKSDIKGKDEEVLNIPIIPEVKKKSSFLIKFIFFIVILLALFTAYSIIKALPKSPKLKSPTAVVTPTVIPTTIPTPTVKAWTELDIMVQNGTSKAGLAAKSALIFSTSGITKIQAGNTDTKDYLVNKLIFKDISTKETYQNKFKELVKIKDENITIDNTIGNDAIFILGLN